jgi:hypothetical protein
MYNYSLDDVLSPIVDHGVHVNTHGKGRLLDVALLEWILTSNLAAVRKDEQRPTSFGEDSVR